MRARVLAMVVATVASCSGIARADGSIGTYVNIPVVTAPGDADLAPYRATGTSSVSGRFNLVMNGSGARLEYVGYDVDLLPAFPWAYAAATSEAEYASNSRTDLLEVPDWMNPLIRHTTTDRHGNFKFEGVPAGSYIVTSLIETVITTDRSYSYPTYSYGYDVTYITTHYVQDDRKCNLSASLQAIVDVKPGQDVVTPIQIAGWAYDGQCSR